MLKNWQFVSTQLKGRIGKFQGHGIFEVESLKNYHFKDKVTKKH